MCRMPRRAVFTKHRALAARQADAEERGGRSAGRGGRSAGRGDAAGKWDYRGLAAQDGCCAAPPPSAGRARRRGRRAARRREGGTCRVTARRGPQRAVPLSRRFGPAGCRREPRGRGLSLQAARHPWVTPRCSAHRRVAAAPRAGQGAARRGRGGRFALARGEPGRQVNRKCPRAAPADAPPEGRWLRRLRFQAGERWRERAAAAAPAGQFVRDWEAVAPSYAAAVRL